MTEDDVDGCVIITGDTVEVISDGVMVSKIVSGALMNSSSDNDVGNDKRSSSFKDLDLVLLCPLPVVVPMPVLVLVLVLVLALVKELVPVAVFGVKPGVKTKLCKDGGW
jgi:hypothetical protein